jgi:hypothetical protein
MARGRRVARRESEPRIGPRVRVEGGDTGESRRLRLALVDPLPRGGSGGGAAGAL